MCTKDKECNSCKKLLPLSEFYKDDKQVSGYKGKCKKCYKARMKAPPELPKYKITSEGRECKSCNKFQSWAEYYKDPSTTTGRRAKCRSCIYPNSNFKSGKMAKRLIVNHSIEVKNPIADRFLIDRVHLAGVAG